MHEWTTRKIISSSTPVEGHALWLTPSMPVSLWFIHTPFCHIHTLLSSWLHSSSLYSWESNTRQTGLKRFCSLLMMLISLCDIQHTFLFPEWHFRWAEMKCVLWYLLATDSEKCHFGLLQENGYCLQEWVRKEGKKEGAPVDVTSFPRVFLSGSSG